MLQDLQGWKLKSQSKFVMGENNGACSGRDWQIQPLTNEFSDNVI